MIRPVTLTVLVMRRVKAVVKGHRVVRRLQDGERMCVLLSSVDECVLSPVGSLSNIQKLGRKKKRKKLYHHEEAHEQKRHDKHEQSWERKVEKESGKQPEAEELAAQHLGRMCVLPSPHKVKCQLKLDQQEEAKKVDQEMKQTVPLRRLCARQIRRAIVLHMMMLDVVKEVRVPRLAKEQA